MGNAVKSSSFEPDEGQSSEQAATPAYADWLRVGSIAAASAVLGGLAAAWFYRKALRQLRDAENQIPSHFPEPKGDGSEEDF